MRIPAVLALLLGSFPAQAHLSEQPLLVHAIEHGWVWLALLPLVLLLLPTGRKRG